MVGLGLVQEPKYTPKLALKLSQAGERFYYRLKKLHLHFDEGTSTEDLAAIRKEILKKDPGLYRALRRHFLRSRPVANIVSFLKDERINRIQREKFYRKFGSRFGIKGAGFNRLPSSLQLLEFAGAASFERGLMRANIKRKKRGPRERVVFRDRTLGVDKEKLARNFIKMLMRNRISRTRPKIDLSRLARKRNEISQLRTKPHVAIKYEVNGGRGSNYFKKQSELGVILVEKGFEGMLPDNRTLREFASRMRFILKCMQEKGDGPNPDTVHVIVTDASTDAKLLQHDQLGFNALLADEGPTFWVLAAAREVAYLKYRQYYPHMRAMSELVTRAMNHYPELVSEFEPKSTAAGK